MKSIRYILLAMTFSAAASLSAQEVAGSQIQIDNKSVSVSADNQLQIGMDVIIPADMKLNSNTKLTLVPVLVEKGGSGNKQTLPAIYVYGRARQLVEERTGKLPTDAFEIVRRDKGTSQTIFYNTRIPYEKWMNGSVIQMMVTAQECADCLTGEDVADVQSLYLEQYAVMPSIIFVKPTAEVKVRAEKGSAYIDFPVNMTTIYPDYRRNPYELEEINRTINVYAQDNYVRETKIHITQDDLVNSLDVTENADDLYTSITVLGNDNVTISAINPIGSNTIYDFSYYFDWMSEELGAKVRAWQTEVESERQSYYDLNLQYYTSMAEAVDLELEIEKYTTQITMYTRCRNNIVADPSSRQKTVEDYNKVIAENGGTTITLSGEINDTLSCIDGLIYECELLQDNANIRLNEKMDTVNSYKNSVYDVNSRLAIMSYFTEEEYTELCHYIFEGKYTDDYVVITDVMTYAEKFAQMKTLYDRALSQLHRVSSPTQEFSVDVQNFIFIKEFEEWSEQLETGCLINVELEANDIAALFLSNMTVNYDDHTLKMTFGNRFNKFDTKSLFDDVLGKIDRSANTLAYIKEVLYPMKSGEFNSMKEALQTSRNLTMGAAMASTNQEVVIDGSGYTGRKILSNGTYDPRQVKLTGSSLVFTDDAWSSCKVAVGEMQLGNGQSAYGINAETIIGDMIIGNNIRIYDDKGNDMFTAVDGMIKLSVKDVQDNVTKLTEIIQGDDGIIFRIQNIEDKEIDSITTSTGYTFNADGLTIYKDGNEIKTLLDNTGMYVRRGGEVILQANDRGVQAVDVTVGNYLVVGGHARFEDYDGGTACFYL